MDSCDNDDSLRNINDLHGTFNTSSHLFVIQTGFSTGDEDQCDQHHGFENAYINFKHFHPQNTAMARGMGFELMAIASLTGPRNLSTLDVQILKQTLAQEVRDNDIGDLYVQVARNIKAPKRCQDERKFVYKLNHNIFLPSN